MNEMTDLYRCFDASGNLLYVGHPNVSADPNAKPIKSPQTFLRWRNDGFKGIE